MNNTPRLPPGKPEVSRERNSRPAMMSGLLAKDIRDNLENCGSLSRRDAGTSDENCFKE
jgi:hypothetical protein